jgi:toxin ParE1/3/4
MRIVYSARAQIDVLNIFSYLNERNPRAAVSVVREIRSRIRTLSAFPLKGPQTDLPGTRRLEIVRYPYFVFYQIEGDTISILHVRHTSRRPWKGGDE